MVLLAKETKLLLKNEVRVCVYIFIQDFFQRHTSLDSVPYQETKHFSVSYSIN